jgi:hypothetical protein
MMLLIIFVSTFETILSAYFIEGVYIVLKTLCQSYGRNINIFAGLHIIWIGSMIYLILDNAAKINPDYFSDWLIAYGCTVFFDLFILDFALLCLAFKRPDNKGFLRFASWRGFYLNGWRSESRGDDSLSDIDDMEEDEMAKAFPRQKGKAKEKKFIETPEDGDQKPALHKDD